MTGLSEESGWLIQTKRFLRRAPLLQRRALLLTSGDARS